MPEEREAFMRVVRPCRFPLLALGLVLLGAGVLAPSATALTFWPYADYSTGSTPSGIACGDFNRDGNLDLVTGNAPVDAENSLTILYGRGDGTFGSRTDAGTGTLSVGVAAGWFWADSTHATLVTTNSAGNSLTQTDYLGPALSRIQQTLTVGVAPVDVAAVDFDSDGHLDVVTADLGGTVTVSRNNRSGGFLSPLSFAVGRHAYGVCAGDFDQDGIVDLVSTDSGDDTVSVLLGDGAGGVLPRATFSAGADPEAVVTEDLDGDGHLDLAVANASAATISVLWGDGSGAFAQRSRYDAHPRGWTTGVRVNDLATGDFDNDGQPDLVAVGQDSMAPFANVLVSRGAGTRSFAAHEQSIAAWGPAGVIAADLDRDGKTDMAVACAGSDVVSVARGRWSAPSGYMAVADAPLTRDRLVQVDSDVNEAAEMRLRERGGVWSDWTPYAAVAYLRLSGGDGQKTVEAQYRNLLGATDVLSGTVRLDTTPPVTSDSASAGWLTAAPASVTLTPDDGGGSGVATTQYKLDGAASWTTGKIVAVTGDGLHTLLFRSVDEAGNVEDTQSRTLRVDAAKPVTTALAPSGAWQRQPVTVTLVGADATSGVALTEYCASFGLMYLDWTPGTSISLTTEGTTWIGYRSTDVAGNVEAQKSLTVRIDMTSPVTTDDAPSGWLTGSPATVTLTPADAGGSGVARTQYRLDGASGWSAGAEVAVVGDGVHTLEYRSVDTAGNVEDAHFRTVKVDGAAPAVSISGVDDLWHTGPVFALFSVSDAVSGISATAYRIDGSSWTPGLGLLVATEGAHTLACKATDAAGNESAEQTAHVRIDATAPVTSAAGPAAWTREAVTLSFSPADALSGMSGGLARTEYSLDGGATWQEGLAAVVDPDPVEHSTDALRVLYRSTDVAGNAEAAKSLVARVDTCLPVTFAKAATVRRGRAVRLPVTVTDAVPGSATATVVIKIRTLSGRLLKTLPAATVATNSVASVVWPRCTLPAGTYRYQVTAVDAAGNGQSRVGSSRLTVR
jgi:hypothetical protein